MQRKEEKNPRKAEKATTLAICLIVIILSITNFYDWHTVGIYAGGEWVGRVLYPLFHAGIIHATLNAWCLICIVFVYNVRFPLLILAYITAVTYPIDTITKLLSLSSMPTVGLSGIVFFLFAAICFQVNRRLYYQTWIISYLAVGFLLPQTNAWLHIYCYACGMIVALLNYPIKR